MAEYVLIDSRDPFSAGDHAFCRNLAERLLGAGDRVAVFLVQNAVLAARSGARASALDELTQLGVEVLADDFSLRERGIAVEQLRPGVKPSALDFVIDCMADGWKMLWH